MHQVALQPTSLKSSFTLLTTQPILTQTSPSGIWLPPSSRAAQLAMQALHPKALTLLKVL